MNQHPRAKEMGITAGNIIAGNENWHGSYYTYEIIALDAPKIIGHSFRNLDEAKVAAQGLTEFNQTGRTPSELVELVRELRSCLYDLSEFTERWVNG
jgi:hypothetical protein